MVQKYYGQWAELKLCSNLHGLNAPALHKLQKPAALWAHLLGVEERLREFTLKENQGAGVPSSRS